MRTASTLTRGMRPRRRLSLGAGAVLSLALTACGAPPEPAETSIETLPSAPDLQAARSTLDAWVAVWNSYDLDQVDDLFMTDGTVTYYSSEFEGRIAGFDALVRHHEGFGFAPGGTNPQSRLWLEDLDLQPAGTAVSATAVWFFRRTPDADEVGRGPVSFVLAPVDGGYRIQHAHFANY